VQQSPATEWEGRRKLKQKHKLNRTLINSGCKVRQALTELSAYVLRDLFAMQRKRRFNEYFYSYFSNDLSKQIFFLLFHLNLSL